MENILKQCFLHFRRVASIHGGAACQTGDADSSWAPDLTSGLHRSVNVHRGALLLVPQCQCISSFVFYIISDKTFCLIHISLEIIPTANKVHGVIYESS